jgi:xanthine dehydrogenase accessory factor
LISDWKKASCCVSLVTVIETWGCAPRPTGAMLAIRDDGIVSGSVSAGCIEDDLISRAKAALQSAKTTASDKLPSLVTYGVTKENAARFGLPCGGTPRLMHEPVDDTLWIEELLKRTTAHELVARTLTVATGKVSLGSAQRGQALQFDDATLTTVFGPKWLLLNGAGQLSQTVASIAGLLDFEVLVCDPREEYAATMAILGAQWVFGMPHDLVRELAPDAHTAIVALTHDPMLDDMALLEALKSNAFYVGTLGSRRNQETRKQRLAEHFDLTEQELSRLHGPVGLSIGGKTPAEIAVSVMAEIVQVKNLAQERRF